MSEHIFKVLLNEEQAAYIYQRAKDEGNISCSQVIAEMVEKAVPKEPGYFVINNGETIMYHCGHCGEWFFSHSPNYCPCCGQAADWNEFFDEDEEQINTRR